MSDKWEWSTEVNLPSRRGAHLPLLGEILEQLTCRGWDGRDFFGVQMALEESLSNAIRHGNKLDETKKVAVECKLNDSEFWIQIEDEGDGFTPDSVDDCTTDEGLCRHGGRGMLLINSYMTSVTHNDRGNRITLQKTREQCDPETP